MKMFEYILLILVVVLIIFNLCLDIHLTKVKAEETLKAEQEIVKTQKLLQDKINEPFVATGFFAKRMDDDRILVGFTRKSDTLPSDLQSVVTVILDPENFDYVSKIVKLRKTEGIEK